MQTRGERETADVSAAGLCLLVTDEAGDNRKARRSLPASHEIGLGESPSDFRNQTDLRASRHLQSICGVGVCVRPGDAHVGERARFTQNPSELI